MNPAPGFVARDHAIDVPLDHSDPSSPSLQVFAREIVAADKVSDDLPWMLFLQGGPGGKSPRPVDTSGWLGVALETHRVLLLDQRGTGRSTPLTAATRPDLSAERLAAYIRHFRADSIVADAEMLRRRLLGDDERWDTLGQSYGGFVTMTYLSTAPHGLRRCHIAGGVPSLTATADELYRRTFDRVARRTLEFYERYPDDARALRRIVDHVESADVRLPDGDRLTGRRLRMLGSEFGRNAGLERVHWLLDDAWQGSQLSDEFLLAVLDLTGFVAGPIYALQEFIYAGDDGATAWAAQRVIDGLPEFACDADPLLLTGEMIFPWMFSEIRALRPFQAAAELLAAYDEWQPLYDTDRLAANEVPVAAVVYHDDLYVDAELSLQTTAAVPNMRAWVTNQWEHDGISSGEVLRRLRDMTAGKV